jgi:hypothetical protein
VKIELFKDAIAVIRGIPKKRIDLDGWQQNSLPGDDDSAAENASQIKCGTIACAGGWLALYPPFQELGLHPDATGVPCYGDHTAMAALARFFEISELQARALFRATDSPTTRSKSIWLGRALTLLRECQRQERKGQ